MVKKSLLCGAIALCSVPFAFSFNSKVQNVSSNEIYITWENQNVSDYEIYLNDEKCESLSDNAKKSNNLVHSFSESFYKYYENEIIETKKQYDECRTIDDFSMLKTDVCFYKFDSLKPATSYKIKINAIDSLGKVVSDSEVIVKTEKKAKIFDIRKFGAKEGLLSDAKSIDENTKAIQKAINKCSKNGEVLIPEGIFMCGSLNLKSDMTLRVDGTLLGSPFAENYTFGFLMYKYYTDKRFFGVINCDGAKNIRIVGKGTVDGNGWKFGDKNGKPLNDVNYFSEKTNPSDVKIPLYALGNRKTIFERGILAASCAEKYLELNGKTRETADETDMKFAFSSRATLVLLRNAENVFISDLTFKNPANHNINIIDSKNIKATGLKILTYNCANGDGIGLICSQNAEIWNNFFDTGDDSIVFSAGVGKIASTTGESGVDNVKIFGNYFLHGHGGVASGSHTALGIKNIDIFDNIFCWSRIPFRVKSNPSNGGEVCDIRFFHNTMGDVYQTFVLTTDYADLTTASSYGAADVPAVFHDIFISDTTIFRARQYVYQIFAEDNNHHYNINFKNVDFVVFHEDDMTDVKNAKDCDFSGVKIRIVEY